jgi:hypothetical protein
VTPPPAHRSVVLPRSKARIASLELAQLDVVVFKATLTAVSGWTAATAAGAAFAAYWTPADAAGPWAWAAHGVGTLIAGGIGYWFGSTVTRNIYELVVE